ncbi:murein biosynthesis integral membrane protein MurJ [Gallicola sp. Sow4_E12]|uniref:murein biosynthesis integral membrane protein MurJ n=1 Tax=Gallicola sp. Sow4_E12 TaxID=3438785 RepID=UPI003F8E33EF
MKSVAAVLMIISALSKILGFLREMVFSYFFGTGITKDAYVIATAIPTILAGFVGTALTIGNIPIYTRENKKGREWGDLFTSRIANLIFVIVTLFVIAVLVYPEGVVKLIAGGYEGEVLKLTIQYMRIMIFSLYAISLFSLYQGYLNANDSFVLSALAPFSMNAVIILFTIAAGMVDKIYLPLGFIVSYFVQFMFIVPGLKKLHYSYRLSFSIKDESVKDFIRLALPMMMALIVSNIANLIDNNIASYLTPGGVSALDYSYRIIGIVTGILIFPITTAIYPTMSKMGTQGQIPELKKIITENSTTISILNVPSIIGLIVLSRPIISAIYGRGAFGEESVLMTSTVLIFYAPMLIGMGITDIYNRAFYSLQDTKTPVIVSSISMIADIVLNFLLSPIMGLSGLALSSSIGRVVNAVLLMWVLRMRIGKIGLKVFVHKFIIIAATSIIMGIFAYVFNDFAASAMDPMLGLMLTIIFATALYFSILSVMKVISIQEIIIKAVRFKKKK